MSHLTLETLARLVDEPPTAAEMEHLEGCEVCRRELDALAAQTEALGELPDLLPPPPEAWSGLERRLRSEGLIRETSAERARYPGPGSVSRIAARGTMLRIAATVAVFLFGGLAGFAARGAIERPESVAGADAAPALPSIRPVDDAASATRALAEAESAYRAALTRYAETIGAEVGADPLARLMALDNIVLTTREALSEAPADPVINGYHLTALAQREATMKQLVLSSDKRWY